MLLSEADKHLITAAVCGRLSAEEKATLRVLVADSPDAAKLFKALCHDRDTLAKLPKTPAPPSVWATVMARVESGPIIVAPTTIRTKPKSSWVPVAVAASLLLALGSAAVWYLNGPGKPNDVVDRSGQPKPAPQPDAGNSTPAPEPDKEPHGPPRPDVVVALAPAPIEPAPFPRATGTKDAFAAPAVEPVVFASIDARLPVLFPVAEATDREVVRKVTAEFATGHAIRLDLFAKDTVKAAEQFAAALRSGGTTLVVDGVAMELQRRRMPYAWATYSESLAATDTLAILKKLADTDAKAGATPVWTAAHLSLATAADGKEAKDLFGLDPASWKRTAGPTSVPTEPLSAGTIAAVTTALGKPPTGNAVLTTYLPVNARVHPANSPQIKKFFDDKPVKKDGAVPLVIVIRPANQ